MVVQVLLLLVQIQVLEVEVELVLLDQTEILMELEVLVETD
tara:strand:- start:438 stop:560 length:123 start_codon:yes stop_codon:yes gene_type:complete